MTDTEAPSSTQEEAQFLFNEIANLKEHLTYFKEELKREQTSHAITRQQRDRLQEYNALAQSQIASLRAEGRQP